MRLLFFLTPVRIVFLRRKVEIDRVVALRHVEKQVEEKPDAEEKETERGDEATKLLSSHELGGRLVLNRYDVALARELLDLCLEVFWVLVYEPPGIVSHSVD